MFKKCQVVMLPTNEKATIALSSNKLSLKTKAIQEESQHLYFLSDEKEIKEGDWFVMNGCIIRQCKSTNNEPHTIHTVVDTTGGIHHVSVCEKVIATTDKSLVEKVLVKRDEIGDLYRSFYLPEPSQSFIEKFIEEYNKENVITEVMVEYIDNEKIVLKVNPKENELEKEIVPYQEALEMKELGFDDEPCFGWFSEDKKLIRDFVKPQHELEFVLAPTYSQAFRWFREKHKLNAISPTRIYKTDFYQARIVNWNNWEEINIKQCDSYEEAELACLKQLIEIIKNKNT